MSYYILFALLYVRLKKNPQISLPNLVISQVIKQAQKGSATCLRSHSQKMTEMGLELGSLKVQCLFHLLGARILKEFFILVSLVPFASSD